METSRALSKAAGASAKTTEEKKTNVNLKSRIEKLEREVRPGELRAAISIFFDRSGEIGALLADDPRLRAGVDGEGEAYISRSWSVWFFEGTRRQQGTHALRNLTSHKHIHRFFLTLNVLQAVSIFQ